MPDGFSLPPEPYAPPARPGLARRAASGLAIAIVCSIAILSLRPLSEALLPPLAAVFDRTLESGWTPFSSIVFAAAASAALGTALTLLLADRRRLRGLRRRSRWYHEELRVLRARRRSRRGDGEEAEAALAAAGATLRRRQRQASTERALELLRPVGWSFLPFALAFLWVAERFPSEPIRPGDTFTVRAYFRPDPEGGGNLRYARLDLEGDPPLRLLDPSYRPIEPNGATPRRAPYRASWLLEARHPGIARLAVTARYERAERDLLVTRERRFADPALRRARGAAGPPEIVSIEVEHAPVRLELPEPAYRLADRLVRAVTGGRGVAREEAALGPAMTFIFAAVLIALVLQRLAGLR